nr:rho GTPase-activating protein 19 [Leptinotarsa decemlineata]
MMCSVNKETDESVAERFKRDYTEQFHILVRMHLSFLLDINTDERECFSEKGKLKKWNLAPFFKKAKFRGVMEGAPLTQEGICQVYQLIEFLKKEENMKSEGIFRRTGSLERQHDLRNLLNRGVTLMLEEGTYNVHDCASVLKSFLSELPDPLLTEGHFPVYWQIAESCGITEQKIQEGKLLEALQLLLLLLPTENKVLLKDILELLHTTASFESFNKMSPDNLAKLFTPHLLCPRKLPPETLLKDSQALFGIISFMIKKSPELFKIPNKLIMDFKAKYEKKRIVSPTKRLNESVTDAASTVFTFVDHERTAKENESNPTETALAQLYAHIQSLPESSKKRKLVKQFNRENGYGTPLQVMKSGNPKNRSFGDSIKRRIFHRGLTRKKEFLLRTSTSDEMLNSPSNSQSLASRARLFCHHNCDSSNDQSDDANPSKRSKKSCTSNHTSDNDIDKDNKRRQSEPDLSISGDNIVQDIYLTSTPACLPLRACPDIVFTPEAQDRKSMSPITRSTQRMTRAMQETMMTPRSRKPVLLFSGTNINTLHKNDQTSYIMGNLTEENSCESETPDTKNIKKSKSEGDMEKEPREHEIVRLNSIEKEFQTERSAM